MEAGDFPAAEAAVGAVAPGKTEIAFQSPQHGTIILRLVHPAPAAFFISSITEFCFFSDRLPFVRQSGIMISFVYTSFVNASLLICDKGGIMPLVTSKRMFEAAQSGHYAIGAFNANNMEIIQGIISAAERESSPVILQVSEKSREYTNPVYLIKLVEAAVATSDVPVCLHLDDGPDYETCVACIDSGYTSVMIDGSRLPFEENIALTKKVVDYAHDHGVVVEGGLGDLHGDAESDVPLALTDPNHAVDFVAATGVDSLAVAIGTCYGPYKFKSEPTLAFERLQDMSNQLPGFPLVLHGASSVPKEFVDLNNQYGADINRAQGVPEDMLREAARLGIAKINIETDLNLVMTACIRQFFIEHPDTFDPQKYLGPGRRAIRSMVIHKMRHVLGCSHGGLG